MIDLKNIMEDSEKLMSKEFSNQLNAIVNEQKNIEFRVPVLGGMKAGKSTLLAKMLECEQSFLPKDNLEATARCLCVSYGFVANRKIVHADGEETFVDSDEQWDLYARGKDSLNPGDKMVVELPNIYLRDNGVALYDTPGNNTVDDSKVEETWSSLIGAQLAVYCVRATAILTKTDVTFLKSALPQLKNFVFALTRLDEAGITDIHSPEALRLVECFKARLKENFSEQPLAVVPVSSALDGERSGIDDLNSVIADILKRQGDFLRKSKITQEFKKIAVPAIAAVQNDIELTKKICDENGDAVAEKIGTFKAKLVDAELEKKSAINRLQVELAEKKQKIRSSVMECGTHSVDRLRSRIEFFSNSRELEDASQGILLSEVDCWRNEVSDVMENLADSNEQIMASAASDFLNRIESSAKEDLNVNFQIVLSNSKQYEVPEFLNQEMEKLEREKNLVNDEILALQQEMKDELSQVPELQNNLEVIRSQLNEVGEYVPQYVEKKYGAIYGETEDALKKIGCAVDWFLTLAPIPMGKVKWLSKFKYGKQIKNVIKKTNKIIKAKDQFMKNAKTLPVLGTALEALSVEFWAGKLGHLIDEKSTTVVMEEDLVAKQEYQSRVAPILNQERAASLQLASLQNSLKEKKHALELQQQQQDSVMDSVERLERDIRDQQIQLAMEKENERLYAGKRQLLEKAVAMFQSSKSNLVAPVLNEIEKIFIDANENMASELVARMDATLADLRKQVENTENTWAADKGKLFVDLNFMQLQEKFLNSLIEA